MHDAPLAVLTNIRVIGQIRTLQETCRIRYNTNGVSGQECGSRNGMHMMNVYVKISCPITHMAMNLDKIRMALRSPVNSVLDPGKFQPAAVLLIICGEPPHIIMTRKSARMRVHAGEISFPGGKPECKDADLCATALRETREEIGLYVDRQKVIGQLQPVSTLSTRYIILPFVSILEEIPEMTPNIEVSDIECIPLESFLSTLTPDTGHGPYPEMYELWYDGKQVWGASARILKQVYESLVSEVS